MNKLSQILLGVAAIALFGLSSCGDDDGGGTPPDAPQIVFDTENFDLSRGESTEVTISVQAPGGLASLTADDVALSFQEGSGENVFTATLTISAELTEATGPTSIRVVATDDLDQSVSGDINYTVIGQLIEYTNTVITSDETWLEGNVYRLSDDLDIDGATLTIEEGVIVQFEVTEDGSGGFTNQVGIGTDDADESGNEGTGRLVINGTAANPVVFTPNSDNPEPGMWEGIRIRGGSGHVFNYVRIEYAGTVEEVDGELITDNFALRMDDVTSADIDYLQLHSPLAGGMRINGGTFNMSHVVINNTNLGNFGADGEGASMFIRDGANGGYVGNIQFLILNNPQGVHGERELFVRNEASITFSNVTGIGSGGDFEDPEEPGELASLDFARFRSSAGPIKMYNSIVAGYADDGIRGQRYEEGEDDLQYTYIFDIGGVTDDGIIPDGAAEGTAALRDDWVIFAESQFNNQIDAENSLIAGIGVNDYVPDAIVSSAFDPTTLGSFFQTGSYVGAIGDTDWTVGWTLNTDGTARE